MASSTRGLAEVPLHGKLSAGYRSTFAYPTIKDRCPVILCKIIDHVYRERINIGRLYGAEAQDGLKMVVEQLSKLRYEMQTNKQIIELTDDHESTKVWNDYLKSEKASVSGVSWYSASWMWAECYMYRRILQSISSIISLRDFDFFAQQKEEGFRESLNSMEHLGEWILNILPDDEPNINETETRNLFETLIQISLWGNKCDLSISAGSKQSACGHPVNQLQSLLPHILVDQTSLAWHCLQHSNQTVDIVMDNSGFELFTDLCLADFLIHYRKAGKIRFRIKNQPWFVSDTTQRDLDWTLNNLCGMDENKPSLSKLGERWKSYLRRGDWTVSADPFWTYPHVYSDLASVDPQLYSSLAEAGLVIFKGDLNYRKLVGDINWETTVPFRTALQGFQPTNILSLRTLKADVVTGLEAGQCEELNQKDKDWMVNGNWGVIQYAAYS